jgi:hypothetical protein
MIGARVPLGSLDYGAKRYMSNATIAGETGVQMQKSSCKTNEVSILSSVNGICYENWRRSGTTVAQSVVWCGNV